MMVLLAGIAEIGSRYVVTLSCTLVYPPQDSVFWGKHNDSSYADFERGPVETCHNCYMRYDAIISGAAVV